MALRHCDFGDCQNAAERTFGSCMLCSKHLCAEHYAPPHHKCPSSETEPKAYYAAYDAAKKTHLDSLLAKINFDALTLRLCDPLLPPQPVQDYVFLSEVATLEFLAETAVPSPKVNIYQLESPENPVGSSFVLMEKMPGTALQWNDASSDQRTKVMQQLLDIFLELEKHPLQQTGSLVPADVRDKIGGFAQAPLFETPGKTLGPFTKLESAYKAMISLQMSAIGNREITSLPVDNYLAFHWRLSALSSLTSSVANDGPFYLKHYDDKGDHILVDDDYKITGIIDWESASAEAKHLAFSSPCMMWPVGDYYDGLNNLSEDETEFARMFEIRGRQDISKIVLNGRRWQRFLFFLGGGVENDEPTFESLFQGLRMSFAIDGEESVSSYKDWKVEAINQYSKEDPILQRLLREKRAKYGKE
ncbi:hypothetical protein N7474_010733 [Penicillium riverlandense]|uniref:uncharacterized protein n=1 Tax=Penicillium riverlandense TaxID=1903569 RepID=UPI002547236D|nr:uncharacterized protein N7474_010733 [Penicillium riverlandense]KAJ5804846.1 hypothetical protein N7474_010733 [Penicillium riverlandense]